MIRIFCLGGLALSLASCGAPIPPEVDTYCPECYERIQGGQAFAPAQAMPNGSTTAAGASR
jgi:hypothetical protein